MSKKKRLCNFEDDCGRLNFLGSCQLERRKRLKRSELGKKGLKKMWIFLFSVNPFLLNMEAFKTLSTSTRQKSQYRSNFTFNGGVFVSSSFHFWGCQMTCFENRWHDKRKVQHYKRYFRQQVTFLFGEKDITLGFQTLAWILSHIFRWRNSRRWT